LEDSFIRQQNAKKRKLNSYQGSLQELEMRSHASQPLPNQEARKGYRDSNRHFNQHQGHISDDELDGDEDAEVEGVPNVRPRYTELPRGVQTVKVSRGQLSAAMKSKLDMYNVLAVEGQIYLPPMDHCPMDFLKQIMSGRKKVSWD
jgi:hypothetical protein